jgi:uncharacterized membrane protein
VRGVMKSRRKPAEADSPRTESWPIAGAEWVFGILAIVVGLFMAFVTPPFQSPDEDAHFFRAVQISEGRVIAEREGNRVGGNIPGKVAFAVMPFERMEFRPWEKVDKAAVKSLLKEPYSAEPRVWRDFMHTAIYSPVAYAPAVVGIWIARLCGSSTLGMLYASRVATLLCWAVLVFFAIRATPMFKWVTVLIGLLPMSVFLAASPSADVMTNALGMLLTGLILRSAFSTTGPFSGREWALILIFSVLVALTKQVYFVLAAMAMMIPTDRFGGMKRKVVFLCTVAGAAIAVNIVWAWLVRGIVITEDWADPKKQMDFMAAQPWKYVEVLWATLVMWWWRYLQWFVGVLGWLDTWLPSWIYPTYLVAIVAAAVVDAGKARPIRIAERVLVVLTCAVTLLLIATSQYITYSAPMAQTIRGVQGRYFIPLAVAGLLVLYNRKVRVPEKLTSLAVSAFCVIVLVITCSTVLSRYWA